MRPIGNFTSFQFQLDTIGILNDSFPFGHQTSVLLQLLNVIHLLFRLFESQIFEQQAPKNILNTLKTPLIISPLDHSIIFATVSFDVMKHGVIGRHPAAEIRSSQKSPQSIVLRRGYIRSCLFSLFIIHSFYLLPINPGFPVIQLSVEYLFKAEYTHD